MKEILHFSHANGFPAGCYSTLFSYLNDDFQIGTIDRLGHDKNYPVSDNWEYLVHQLIDYFEQHYNRPVYAVGHSLGGVLSMMVAAQRPDLVKGLIMLDSPFLTTFESFGVSMFKRFGFMDKITPAGRTLGRKEQWDSIEHAAHYFKNKKLFNAFDERCLKDYIHQGTQELNGGRRQLHFDAATEISIYRTIPSNLHNTKRLAMPSAVMGGKYSDVFKKHHAYKMKHQLGMQVHWLEGTHMFPLERPEATAKLIQDTINRWSREYEC